MVFVMDKSKSLRGLLDPRFLSYVTEAQWDISDLPFVRNKRELVALL